MKTLKTWKTVFMAMGAISMILLVINCLIPAKNTAMEMKLSAVTPICFVAALIFFAAAVITDVVKAAVNGETGMKALNIGGWLLLAASASHCLTGVISGEFSYPSMRTFWLIVMSAVCLFLSLAMFTALAIIKRRDHNMPDAP